MHRLERERRAVEADARARDVRLQRALDEVARYKALVEEARNQVWWLLVVVCRLPIFGVGCQPLSPMWGRWRI
jgi:hypothetical protein